MENLGTALATKLKGQASQFLETVRESLQKSWKLLKSLPVFALNREAEYREVLSAKHRSLAAEGSQLRHFAKQAKQAQKALEVTSSALASSQPEAPSTDWSTVAQQTEALGQCLVTHLTVFAAVTLLRSPVIGAKSDAGKKLARNLQDLLRTLLEKDMLATPDHEQLPRENVLKLCKDCEDAVWPPAFVEVALLQRSAAGPCPHEPMNSASLCAC